MKKLIFKIIYFLIALGIIVVIISCQEGSVYPVIPSGPQRNLVEKGFPSAIGNHWIYYFESFSLDKTDTIDVIITDKKALQNGDTVIFFETSYRHSINYLGEKIQFYEYYTYKGDTIKCYLYGNPFDLPEDSILTYNYLVFPLKVGKGWIPERAKFYDSHYKDTAFVENMVNFDTPKGTFWDIYSIRKIGLYENGYEETFYFDPRIGMVAQVTYQRLTYEDFTYTTKYNSMELLEFQIK